MERTDLSQKPAANAPLPGEEHSRRISFARRYPATALLAAVIIGLFVAVQESAERQPDDPLGAHSHWGAVARLYVSTEPELWGHFQLWGLDGWDGQWWRVPVSGLHHADLLHLLSNLVVLLFLGRWLETRLGFLRFLLFVITATTVSLLPCFLLEETVIGLSGGLYAIFGLLLIRRFSDEELQQRLTPSLIGLGLLCLPLGWLTNALGLSRISNLGHLSGLLYGVVAGFCFFPPERRPLLRPRWFLASHLLLIPLLWFVTHPLWNARYQWYRAWQSEGARQLALLQEAARQNPRLSGVWRDIARLHQEEGNVRQAWDARLKGVASNPTDRKMMDVIAQRWQRAGERERQLALRALRSVFPRHSFEWQKGLGLLSEPALPPLRRPWLSRSPLVFLPAPLPPLPRGFDLFWPPVDGDRFATSPRPTVPPVDPDAPDSALLGRTL